MTRYAGSDYMSFSKAGFSSAFVTEADPMAGLFDPYVHTVADRMNLASGEFSFEVSMKPGSNTGRWLAHPRSLCVYSTCLNLQSSQSVSWLSKLGGISIEASPYGGNYARLRACPSSSQQAEDSSVSIAFHCNIS